MTRPFDIPSGLERAQADREGAWQFVRGFARHWARPLTEDDGFPEAELARAEARLGLTLPVAMREAYGLLGRRGDLTSHHDQLLRPDELCVEDGALVFRYENQGVCAWGVLLEDLGQDDPAVRVRMDLADKRAQRWEPWMGRLSWAFVEIVLAESLGSPEHLCDFLYEPSPDTVQIIEQHCAPLTFPAYPADGFESTRWFLGDDVLLRDEGGFVPVRARTEAALEAVRDLLPGEWLRP